MKGIHKYVIWAGYICFTGLVLFLTFNRHSKSGCFNYHSEIWGDKAGYYVYLPATLKFGFDPHNFPSSIDEKTGNGFKLDYKNRKVLTKYTYGVALLQLPFFLIADIFAETLNQVPIGFTPFHHWSINVAAIFYLILGFLFLAKYLKCRFKDSAVYLVILSLFFATNLYYYSIDETGMSHVYSFSLFCIYLYLLQKTNYLSTQKTWESVLFGVISGLIILIRPSNVIFLGIYFFLDAVGTNDILLRLKRILRLKTFMPFFAGAIIVLSPQIIYWQYTFQSLICYTYGNEGFNWTNPKLLQTCFSPNNGLFLYCPLFLVILVSIIYMLTKRIKNGALILVLFLTISYIFSSWWDWGFGCSFGARSYVEYFAIFSIPLAHLFEKINRSHMISFSGFWLLIIALAVFNLKMTYSYDGCFYGSSDWDWNSYLTLLTSPTK